MTRPNGRTRGTAYRKGGHTTSEAEIQTWRATTLRLAMHRRIDLNDVLIDHDTSRRQYLVALLSRIQFPKENAPHIDVVFIPNIGHLGFDESTQKKTKEHLENLGVTVIETDEKDNNSD